MIDFDEIYSKILEKSLEILADDNLSADFKLGFCDCFNFLTYLGINERKDNLKDE